MLESIISVAASQTDLQLVSAFTNHTIDVYEFRLSPAGTATNFTFNSKGGGAGTAKYPTMNLPATNVVALGNREARHPEIKTNAGESLTVTTGTGATVNGIIRYLYKAVLG